MKKYTNYSLKHKKLIMHEFNINGLKRCKIINITPENLKIICILKKAFLGSTENLETRNHLVFFFFCRAVGLYFQ